MERGGGGEEEPGHQHSDDDPHTTGEQHSHCLPSSALATAPPELEQCCTAV